MIRLEGLKFYYRLYFLLAACVGAAGMLPARHGRRHERNLVPTRQRPANDRRLSTAPEAQMERFPDKECENGLSCVKVGLISVALVTNRRWASTKLET